jgi:transcriptional regulator with XRE-family HTH domain
MADTSGRSVRLKVQLVKKLRLERGWNQQDLAEKTGYSKRTIENAETGLAIGIKTAEVIAKTLKVELPMILEIDGLTDASPPPPPPTSPPQQLPPSPQRTIVDRKIAPSRIFRHAARVLFGREKELAALDAAWAKPNLNVYTLVAWGGAGKTSLVAEWVKSRFEANGWPGVERYFDWSFYSQGTGDQRQTSSDQFIQAALTFFGDTNPTLGTQQERGERLGRLIRQHRTLLVLDGIEPLQYPPTDASKQGGRLKDAALQTLLQTLVADNPGLCVVTTREHLKDIEARPTTEEQKLDKLTKEAAVALLRHLQVVGTDAEMHAAWKDAGGHALTLQLLGRFLADAHGGDIRRYDQVEWGEAEEDRRDGRSAFKVMIAYEGWLAAGGAEQQRELAILRLTGLFDRPMSNGCLGALRAEPAIPGLTDALVGVKETKWNVALKRLAEVDLLNVAADSIDAHPLVREYFAKQLKDTQPAAFKEAHSRLFDYLCKNTPPRPDTLEGLGPLYEAVTHGCLAGRHQEAIADVYHDRIYRGTGSDGFYSQRKLGAIGANLAAVAAFFDEPRSRVSPNLREGDQAWLLNEAAYLLRALGRLTEAVQPMRAGLEGYVQQKNSGFAARLASNLSELEVTLGRMIDALTDGRQSITHADQSGDAFLRMGFRTTAADALHQSGQRAEAGTLFAEAERMQKERQPEFNLLYSLPGFRYCDWLLFPAERTAWQALLRGTSAPSVADGHATTCNEVERRGKYALNIVLNGSRSLLDIALNNLTLARVGLIRAILANPLSQPTLDLPHVTAAVNGLRAAGTTHHIPRGLLTAALYHFVRGEDDLARQHLAECQQIAERGPMPLYLADVHLHRARMFRDKAELAKAAKLIRDLGYGRRYDELADAEEAAKGW